MTSIPLLCLPIAYGLVFLPKLPLSMAMARQPEGYDNRNPRDQQAKLTGWGKRAAAAHANGFESFAPFAAGVLACQVTGASPSWAAIFAVAYVVSRALYAAAYIGNIHMLRSSIWTIGFGATLALLLLPGAAVRASPPARSETATRGRRRPASLRSSTSEGS